VFCQDRFQEIGHLPLRGRCVDGALGAFHSTIHLLTKTRFRQSAVFVGHLANYVWVFDESPAGDKHFIRVFQAFHG
jgi:hypothetical protein